MVCNTHFPIDSGNTTVIITDGMDGGLGNRHWMFLGKYDFDGSKGDCVTQQINDASSAGAMRTSGVMFIKDDPNTEEIKGTIIGGQADPSQIEYGSQH